VIWTTKARKGLLIIKHLLHALWETSNLSPGRGTNKFNCDHFFQAFDKECDFFAVITAVVATVVFL
jgi:hypothetical protein